MDAYIESLPTWQQAICRQVRRLVHAADPDVVETIKRTRQPYFTLDGNICALLAARQWVNVFLYDGAMVPDPHGIITSGHDNKTARTVAIRQGERDQRPRPHGDVQADYREQSRRRLEEAEGRPLISPLTAGSLETSSFQVSLFPSAWCYTGCERSDGTVSLRGHRNHVAGSMPKHADASSVILTGRQHQHVDGDARPHMNGLFRVQMLIEVVPRCPRRA